jgi:cytochrome c553
VLLITAGLIGSLLYVGTAGGVARFGDVKPHQFYTEAVQWMVDNGITTGTSEFCFSPDDFVTRGQAAAFIWRMEGEPQPPQPHPFGDVTAAYQQNAVSWMFAQQITTGTSATTYSPADFLTRGQMAALIWRLAGNPMGSPPHPFTDVFASWQIPAVSWLFAQGITTGTTPTLFSPDDNVTRGQLAAFFYRYKETPPVGVDASSPNCGTPTSPGDVVNCDDFADIDAAQRYHDYYFPFYGDVAGLDSDNDGIVCEAAPLPSTTSTSTTTTTSTTSTSTTSTSTTTTAPPNGMALFLNTPTGPGLSTQSCATCHGNNGNGTMDGPDINPLPGNINSVNAVLNQINTGGNGMPTDFMARMTAAQRQAVAQWVWDNF